MQRVGEGEARANREKEWNFSRRTKNTEFYISMLDFLYVASQANVRVNRMINENWNFDREVEM